MSEDLLRVGSFCTGLSGLEIALGLAGVRTETVFVSDIDSHSMRWLEMNIDAPNLGDLTLLDAVPEVDVITAGWPCQPVSHAGKRAGVHDERWIFDDITRLVSGLRSRPVLFLENVYGLLTANDGLAFARVVHGLASIGYGLEYGHLPASAVGAPHRRARWWGFAYPIEHAELSADASSARLQVERFRLAIESEESGSRRDLDAPLEADALLPDADSASGEARSDPRSERERSRLQPLGSSAHARRLERVFGRYAAVVARWELILDREAPSPVDNENRLSATFVEWMMGYDLGYVTDTIVHRTSALRLLGNSVVPQAGAEALRQLSSRAWPTPND